MDEKVEKAFATANFMATLSNQRRIILEEYNQKLLHYVNGATFKIDYALISFVKTLIELGNTSNVVLVDSNNFPMLVEDLESFLKSIVDKYLDATSQYATKFNEIKIKRKIIDIVEL
jgi:hypothetical protein